MKDNSKLLEKNKRKMSSIAGKLHRQLVLAKLGAFFAADIFLAAMLFLFWIIDAENAAGIDIRNILLRRRFTFLERTAGSFTYTVSENGTILLQKNASLLLAFVVIVVSIALFFQLLKIVFPYYGEYRRIKKTLGPINEMALKADEISRLSFDESKFHTIENAIEHISPEQTRDLSLGDSDLQGIEAAINNMLHRMHDTYMQQARFVNDASHELRTPISVIQGYTDMLNRWGKDDPEVLEESITAIKQETDHMKHLVEQLLFLARGDAGRNEVKMEKICLNNILKQIYDESLMIDKDHTYKLHEQTPEVFITGDEGMIKQTVRILADNAAKYTSSGDEIVFSVGLKHTDAMHPYIQVQDSGAGMAEADVRHMFERFYRADDTRQVQGTGLGLSIAKWIMDMHGGHFEITSRKEIGTRITMVF